jgi:hypothetical protein
MGRAIANSTIALGAWRLMKLRNLEKMLNHHENFGTKTDHKGSVSLLLASDYTRLTGLCDQISPLGLCIATYVFPCNGIMSKHMLFNRTRTEPGKVTQG